MMYTYIAELGMMLMVYPELYPLALLFVCCIFVAAALACVSCSSGLHRSSRVMHESMTVRWCVLCPRGMD